MFRNRPALSIALTLLLALRAVVPIGYMLQLPSANDPFGISIMLCPTQNPGLDLSVLTDGPDQHANHHRHHHLHGHDGAINTTEDAATDLRGFGCGPWLNGATAAVNWVISEPMVDGGAERHQVTRIEFLSNASPRGHSLTRAPPLLG
ncbi:MAG: hypothetical protein VX929_11245 [Pseudomonadota bacterium]|nr:hypothetical protein [Pseudomonadota bacterium]